MYIRSARLLCVGAWLAFLFPFVIYRGSEKCGRTRKHTDRNAKGNIRFKNSWASKIERCKVTSDLEMPSYTFKGSRIGVSPFF